MWFTSDWHIGHANAIKFDQRPFKDLDHMHETLIAKFNKAVSPTDTTWFLGDMGSDMAAVTKVMQRLNGRKILLWGNHDKSFGAMYNAGFDLVLYSASLSIHGQKVTLSHCPLRDTWREDLSHIDPKSKEPWHGHDRPKHRMCSVPNEGQFAIHGHIHSAPWKTTCSKTLGRQMDVGVVGNNYRPYHIGEIESWIVKTLEKEAKNE
jgi:calcineurin-like phosphoesterase family protein